MNNYEHELHKALVEAFTVEGLQRMLRYQMGIELETISRAADKESVVAALIAAAVREGWFRGLVNAAYEANPGNERLQFLMRTPQIKQMAANEMGTFDVRPVHDANKQQSLSDRVIGLEFTVYGNQGLNGLVRSVRTMNEKLERIEAGVALRNNTPIGPRAAQVLLIIVTMLTVIAAGQPAWDLIVLIWSRLGGG